MAKNCKYCNSIFSSGYSFKVFCCNECKIKWHNRDNCVNKKEKMLFNAQRYKTQYPEKYKEMRKKTRFKNRIKNYLKSKEYKEKHRDQIREYQKEYSVKWALRNKEKVKQSRINNKAKRKLAIGKISANDIIEQLNKQMGKCFWCSIQLEKYHVDHIIPLSKKGTNTKDNICISCPTCNVRKNDLMPEEWLKRLESEKLKICA